MNYQSKILSLESLPAWRTKIRKEGEKLVVTNGCFDLLHVGHVTLLQLARELGDHLLVGVNGDAGVRALKGDGRPLNTEADRSAVVAALASVDAVCVFPEKTATRFLNLAEPDVYVKGGDYTLESLNQEERQAVERASGSIRIIPFVPGKSTSGLLKRILRQ